MADSCECKQEGRISTLEQRDISIQETLHKLESKVDLILLQVTKVAVLEANHDHQSEALARAFARIETLEGTLKKVNDESFAFINQARGMQKMAYWMWGAMGTGLGAMMLKILFGGNPA